MHTSIILQHKVDWRIYETSGPGELDVDALVFLENQIRDYFIEGEFFVTDETGNRFNGYWTLRTPRLETAADAALINMEHARPMFYGDQDFLDVLKNLRDAVYGPDDEYDEPAELPTP